MKRNWYAIAILVLLARGRVGGNKVMPAAVAGRLEGRRAAVEPAEQIHVVAAFGQEHGGAALLPIVPFAADIRSAGMRHAHHLVGLHGDQFADFAAEKQLFYLKIKRGITKHVADHQPAVLLVRRLFKQGELLLIVGDGFFKQHVVAEVQKRQRRFDMQFVHGGIDDRVGEFSSPYAVLHARKKHILLKGKFFLCQFPSEWIGIDHRDHLQTVGIVERVLRVRRASVAEAYHNYLYAFHSIFLHIFKI